MKLFQSKSKVKFAALLTALTLSIALLSGCGSGPDQGSVPDSAGDAQPVELVVFAAASMTESLTKAAELYKEVAPQVSIVCNFDSSGTLKTQIQEGAVCDIFLSAAQIQMDQLDAEADASVNTEGLDLVASDTRVDLLGNSVVLVVPAHSETTVKRFEDLASDQAELIALGNSDVPVGQYSEEILTHMGIWDTLNQAQKITFATNVKEVLAQVAASSVTCGIVYSTDAGSEPGVRVVSSAPENSCQPIVYPAAVLKNSEYAEEAQAFLNFLSSPECSAVFEAAGFQIPAK